MKQELCENYFCIDGILAGTRIEENKGYENLYALINTTAFNKPTSLPIRIPDTKREAVEILPERTWVRITGQFAESKGGVYTNMIITHITELDRKNRADNNMVVADNNSDEEFGRDNLDDIPL